MVQLHSDLGTLILFYLVATLVLELIKLAYSEYRKKRKKK